MSREERRQGEEKESKGKAREKEERRGRRWERRRKESLAGANVGKKRPRELC